MCAASPIQNVQQLAEAVQAIERPWKIGLDSAPSRHEALISTAWPAVDQALGGGLPLHTIHEWFTPGSPSHIPPFFVLTHLVKQMQANPNDRSSTSVIWIGRRCWPYGSLLGDELLACSIFVDPPDDAARLWAIDRALRCPAVTAVVADGTGLQMPQTRRLQLAAESGGVLALLSRSDRELKTLSAAGTRWLIEPSPTANGRLPRWIVQLLRCKGMQPTARTLRWALELDDATNRIRASGELVD